MKLLCVGLLATLLAGCATSAFAPTYAVESGEAPLAAPIVSTDAVPVTGYGGGAHQPSPELSTEWSGPVPVRGSVAAPADDDGWRFFLAPYAWLLSVDGNATVKGTTAVADEDFSDLWDNLNLVLEGRFEAWKGKWGLLADITYVELESDIDVGPVSGDTSTDIVMAFMGGIHRFLDQDYANAPGGLKVDGIAGIAYTSMDVDLDLDSGMGFDGDENWVDPIIGLRARWDFNEKWGGSLETILGGFELFDGAELVNMNTMLVRRRIGKAGALYFGWRNLNIDYDDGDHGSDKFSMDVNLNGPIIGLGWHF